MKLPLVFSGSAHTISGIQQGWSVHCGENKVNCSIPKEFGGPGAGFSPEDFFLQSLINCFIGTFKVSAELSKVIYSELSVQGEITLDTNENKQTVIKSCLLKIKATGVLQPERFTHIVNKVIKSGFILNSVKTDMSYEISCQN